MRAELLPEKFIEPTIVKWIVGSIWFVDGRYSSACTWKEDLFMKLSFEVDGKTIKGPDNIL